MNEDYNTATVKYGCAKYSIRIPFDKSQLRLVYNDRPK